jgi:hypothetical protein
MSNTLCKSVTKASTDWGFEKSDHAAVRVDLVLLDKPKKGQGIIKVNTQLLDNPIELKKIELELKLMLDQIPEYWNDHQRLEFLKVSIRSVMSEQIKIAKKEVVMDIKDLEESLEQMVKLKIEVLKKVEMEEEELSRRIEPINIAINDLKRELETTRNKFSRDTEFRTQAHWYENGEKPNKFFLNLNKFYQKQKLITYITDEENQYQGQDQVIGGIRRFYEKLYSRNDTRTVNQDDSFFDECPKLSKEKSDSFEKDVTKDELLKALMSCKHSAPGSDGIPYIVYRKLWHIVGDYIHKSWLYSKKTNSLPPSHIESVITILPKEGKNLNEIKNWRPITLSNCDAKIITKALAARMAGVLDEIIDPSQTAYVPGRSVMDNIRSNIYMKDYCITKSIDAILVSLDAKKAFDSVNHDYIETVLEKYGFGPVMRKTFRILYNDIKARILVNGHFSESINIERGVKQGDALSCAIFILCIDPLIRNLNKNDHIKGVQLKTKLTKIKFQHKSSGYADDISIICKDTKEGLEGIFSEYQRLTNYSGLELHWN